MIKQHLSTKLLLIIFLLSISYQDLSAQLRIGSKPLPFKYFDSQGKKIILSNYAQYIPVIITFFATYCKPCKKEIPFLIKESKKGTRFKLLLVSADIGNEIKIRKFFKNIGVQYPYIFDPNGQILNDFGPNKLPLTIFIGKSGKIVNMKTGFKKKSTNIYKKIIKSLEAK